MARYGLIFLCLFAALTGHAQNQRMNSLIVTSSLKATNVQLTAATNFHGGPGTLPTNSYYWGIYPLGSGDGAQTLYNRFHRPVFKLRDNDNTHAIYFGDGSGTTGWKAITWDIQGRSWDISEGGGISNDWPRYTFAFMGADGLGQDDGFRLHQSEINGVEIMAFTTALSPFGRSIAAVRPDNSLWYGGTNQNFWPTYLTGSEVIALSNFVISVGMNLTETAAMATPSSGRVALYAKSDGKVYIKDDAGTETDLTAGGAGGSANYINQPVTNATLVSVSGASTTTNAFSGNAPADGSQSTWMRFNTHTNKDIFSFGIGYVTAPNAGSARSNMAVGIGWFNPVAMDPGTNMGGGIVHEGWYRPNAGNPAQQEWYLRFDGTNGTSQDRRPFMFEWKEDGGYAGPFIRGAVTIQNMAATTNITAWGEGSNHGKMTHAGDIWLEGNTLTGSGSRGAMIYRNRTWMQFEPTANGADYWMGVATDETTMQFGANNGSGHTGLIVSMAIAHAPVSVNLTADNQSISCTNRSYIKLSSDNGTAGNRTFVLTGTVAAMSGQVITLEWTGTNAGELADDGALTGGGNVRLSAVWTPTQYDTLSLRFNGTDLVEESRSTN